jgi:hypothetical protein
MKCVDCPVKYIGKMGRTRNIRYKEHVHAIRNSSSNSGYSKITKLGAHTWNHKG